MSFNPLGADVPLSLRSLQDEMNNLLSRFYHGGVSTGPFDGQEWAPAIDLLERDECYVLHMDVPGVSVNDIDLSYQDGVVAIRGNKPQPDQEKAKERRIRGERRFGAFCRKVDMPADIDADGISAKCIEGVLEVTLPKSHTSIPKAIKVEKAQ